MDKLKMEVMAELLEHINKMGYTAYIVFSNGGYIGKLLPKTPTQLMDANIISGSTIMPINGRSDANPLMGIDIEYTG